MKKTIRLASGIHNAKFKILPPSLKSSFDRDLKSHFVYEIKGNGCRSIFVGQTSRHVTLRISEHQRKGSLVGQHIVECSGSTNDIEWKILDACRTAEKLLTIEAIYNTQEGYLWLAQILNYPRNTETLPKNLEWKCF